MNENERPELGTTEAAVRACVNLIALATHTDEEHLAYWLDCYYQLRVAHEGMVKLRPLALEDLRNSPVAADLAQAYMEAFPGGGPDGDKTWKDVCAEASGPPKASAPTEEEKPEPPAAQKKTGLR